MCSVLASYGLFPKAWKREPAKRGSREIKQTIKRQEIRLLVVCWLGVGCGRAAGSGRRASWRSPGWPALACWGRTPACAKEDPC
jgi:hypothetical protein